MSEPRMNGHAVRARSVPKAIFFLDPASLDIVYGPNEQRDLLELTDLHLVPQTRASIQANLPLLAETEILLTSWGAPLLDEAFLAAAPRLRAVFHAAGSIRPITTPASWP
jgi:hypothetical protein